MVCVLSFFALLSLFPSRADATTGINQELSFEGKVVNASGINIADGSYNMEFKIYSGGTATGGGTLVWTEDWLVHNSQAVTFTSGTFQVNLGAVNAFGTSVNWNSNPLYLSMQVGNTSNCTVTTTFQSNCGGDGEMNPYILLAATPYAMNSNQLGGLTASQFVQLAPGSAQADSSTNSSVFINKTGASGDILELQNSGSDVLGVGNSGAVTLQNASDSTAALQVKNHSGAGILTVDTSNGNVVLGNDGTPAALTVRGGAASGTNTSGANITFDASNGTGTGGSGDLVFRTAAASGSVGYDTSSSSNADTFGSTLTWTHTTTSNTNRLIIVSVIEGNGDSVFSVGYGSATLSPVSSTLCFGSGCKVEVWATATNVPSGANTVTVTWTSSTNHRTAGASTYYNVNTSTPLGTAVTATGSGSPASVTVGSTTTQQLVADAFGFNSNATWTPGSGQTQGVNQNNATNGTIESSSKSGAAGSTSMSWTSASSPSWGEIGVPINAAANSSADTLTDRLHITAAGNIGINNASPTSLLDVGGTFRVRPSANSTTVFQIQNAGGTNVLSVDTSNLRVNVGAGSTGEATPSLFVLDSQTGSSSDPTEVNGAMYYNTTLGENRCGIGGIWSGCGGFVASNNAIASAFTGSSTSEQVWTPGTNITANTGQTYQLPASYCIAGRTITIHAEGIYSTTTTAQPITLKVKVGTAVLGATGANTPTASMTGQHWNTEYNIICLSTTSAIGEGFTQIGTSTLTTTGYWPMENAAAVTIPSAASNLTMSVTFGGTTSASNTITLQELIIRASGP